MVSKWRNGGRVAVLAFVAVSFLASLACAQDAPERVEVGLAFRFMPTGSFDWSGRNPAAGSSLGAYPALGAAPFVDYRLNRFASIGFMPEFTMNIIPRVENYPVSAMIAGSLRVKLQVPGMRFLVPYVVLAPGYSSIFCYGDSCSTGGTGRGFVLGAYGGARLPIHGRHALFAEAGYMRGFQKDSGHDYASSYVVIAAGWQASL
jgi:hypothetical protein